MRVRGDRQSPARHADGRTIDDGDLSDRGPADHRLRSSTEPAMAAGPRPRPTRSSTRSTPSGRATPSPSTPTCGSGPRSTGTTWASGWWPATPTAWPSCATGGPARTASTWPPTGCPRGSGPRSPRTTRWPRPCSRCGRSSSATRPTTPGCGGWCPRPSPPRWWSRCGTGPSRWSTSCSTPPSRPDQVDLLEAFAYPAAGAGHLRPARACRSRTRTGSRSGRTRWPAGSIPTSCSPTRSSRPGARPCSSSPSTSSSCWPSGGGTRATTC